METWRRSWNIHMDFILQTFPLQTEWFTVGCITVFQRCIHCHCVIEKRAASNYNRGHICSQCFLWLMCEGCGRSSNEVQMARIETLLIDSAWQTIASTTDISVLGAEVGEMSDESTKHETGSHVILIITCNVRKCSYCVQAQGTESHLALIWCHCLFFHLSAMEVMQTPQIVWLMAVALHINSIHCLCELQLPLTLIKYWYPCKHSCHIE